jgi:hypothetical protein
MKVQSLSHSVNIMLTPQFYTLKKEKLPLKYLYQAKKIAPSLFDGFLEDAYKYDYLVYKEEDEWIFIAYDPKAISDFLVSKGIMPEQIGKIFFAQQVSDFFTAPVLLGEKEALVSLDNTVVVIPQIAMQENGGTLTFDDSFTPKTGVTLEGVHESVISKKQTIGLIDTNERKKREIIKTLAGMIFKGVKVGSFSLNEKAFQVEFICSDAKVAKRLIQLAKKSEFNSAKIMTGNVVHIEEKL